MRWHVQIMGEGPALLLLHGTGASCHSWRDVVPLLSPHFTLLIPDLPGHAFTSRAPAGEAHLPAVAHLMADLLAALDYGPVIVAGHSAGAAIGLRLALHERYPIRGVISFNGALSPFPGMAGQIFPAMAKLLFLNPLTPRIFAMSARDMERVKRLIHDTGSRIDETGLGFYGRLFRNADHVAGTLAMMASWDLEPLVADMPNVAIPVRLVAAGGDRAVSPGTAKQAAARIPGAETHFLSGLGHLAHEEAPQTAADLIFNFAISCGHGTKDKT